MDLENEIKQLTVGMEDQRDTMELKNNELEITLEKCNQKIIQLDAAKLELETRLQQKEDLEVQLGSWKAHHDTMEMSKGEL